MLVRLIALGTLGYVAYRYLEKNGGAPAQIASPGSGIRDDIPLAGGPLSSHATLQHTADAPKMPATITNLP